MTSTTTTSEPSAHDQARRELRAFLTALAEPPLTGGLFELRARHGQLMRRRFIAVEFPDQAAAAILRIGTERDVYIGAAVRAHSLTQRLDAGRGGGRAAVPRLSSLWVDADTPETIARLRAFRPSPAILVATGRGRHAYWLLDHPVNTDSGEDANRRLAEHLTADTSCHDAARILRPPHTRNHRYQPARLVKLLRLAADERRPLAEILAALPAIPARATRLAAAAARESGADPLLAVEPAYYIQALLGVTVGRDRKISCPFHTDRHPSLHVYPTAEQGWHCFSCRRGGSVYDLAAQLWGIEPRGAGFLRLRALLHERLFGRAA